MIDPHREPLILLKRANEHFPNRVHRSTPIRWALKGLQGERLESIKIGGRRYTSKAAIARFIKRLSETSPEGTEPESLMDQKRKAEAAAQAKAIF